MTTVQSEKTQKSVETIIFDSSNSPRSEVFGFAHLGDILRSYLSGSMDQDTLASLLDSLWDRLETAQKSLEDLSARSWAGSKAVKVRENTETLLDELGAVLELIEEHLETCSQSSVEEAISALEVVRGQFGRVLL